MHTKADAGKTPVRKQNGRPRVEAVVTPGNLALLDPAAADVLRPLLTYPTFAFEQAGPCGHRRTAAEVAMAVSDFHGRLAVPAGLLPRCVAELEAQGYEVNVADERRYGRRFEVDKELREAVNDDDQTFLEAVAREPLGQVEARGFRDAVRKAALVCKLFPKARVVAAVAAKRSLGKVWDALEKALGERVGLLCSGHERIGVRCVVCTYPHLAAAAREADVLLLLDGAAAGGDVAVGAVGGATASGLRRVYAFVAPSRRPERRTRLRLEGAAGPVIHPLEPARAAVRVAMLPSPRGTGAGERHGLERKRRAYWHNQPRNQRVAAAAGGAGRRRPRRPAPARRPDARYKTSFSAKGLAVLVESTEHGRRLLRRLPGAVLLDAAAEEDEDNDDEQDADGARREPGADRHGRRRGAGRGAGQRPRPRRRRVVAARRERLPAGPGRRRRVEECPIGGLRRRFRRRGAGRRHEAGARLQGARLPRGPGGAKKQILLRNNSSPTASPTTVGRRRGGDRANTRLSGGP